MAKILIIEDTENNRVLLSRRLKPRGHVIITAEDGGKGVLMAIRELPDLILMDIGLPGIDGWTATRRIKDDPATKHIAVIALTAHAMTTDRERATESGCDEYETKPIDFNRLFEKLDSLLAAKTSPFTGL